jgi:Response regulator of the LytR/AlgR family
MVRTLIIDDEPTVIQDMQLLMKKHPGFLVVGHCGSLTEARILIPHTNPDLLLLDIELRDGIAFDLLSEYPGRTFQVIFITAYNHYAINAIKFSAFDYLLKPVDEEELAISLQKFVQRPISLQQQNAIALEHLRFQGLQNRLVLRSKHYLQVVVFDDILYCEGAGSYTNFFLLNKRKFTASHSIKEYEQLLPYDRFIRTHQSYLVNISLIDRLHIDGYLVLRNGTEIPVSARRKDTVSRMLTGENRT